MKKFEFNIEIYDWTVFIVLIKNQKDHLKLEEFLSDKSIKKKDLKHIVSFVKDGITDGGEALFNGNKRTSIVIIYESTNEAKKINIISHEKRHCEDRILNWLYIRDMESAAFLAGYLAEHFYPFALLK